MSSKKGFSIHRIFSPVVDPFKSEQQQKLQEVIDLLNNIESEWSEKLEELEIQKTTAEETVYKLKAECEDEKERLNTIESELQARSNMAEIKYEEVAHENKKIKDKLCSIESEWKTKLEEQRKTAEEKSWEQKATFEKEKKDLKDKLASVESEWKTKLEEQKKAAEMKTQEQKTTFEKEKKDLIDKLISVESEWKTKLEKQEKYTQREEHSYAEQIKQLNVKHQKEVERLECELKSHVCYLEEKLYEEQKKTKYYRQYVEFLIEPRQQILDYSKKAVEIIQLVQDARLKALDFERKNLFADDNVSYFYQKSILKFLRSTCNKTIESWIAELPQFARTGMYSTDNSSLLRSVFSDKKTAADNMKYRLHHDLMAEYGSAALILLQELSSLEQLSGTRVDSTAIMYFKETLKTVMKKLVDLEYQIVYVELFTKFRASDDFRLVRSVSVDFFEHDVVLEVQKMAIRYGGTKDKTEVIINR